jgi:hypothetical protein
MAESLSLEFVCSECGAEALLRREPVYEGFKKTGERLLCSACGHEFESTDQVPFRSKEAPAVFDNGDRPEPVTVFNEDERHKNCRYCKHYVVNPFVQRCDLHRRFVEATDFCPEFEKKPEDGE